MVTTLKNTVDHIVTEYGVAEMRGRSISQRAQALIAIADPRFREDLTREADSSATSERESIVRSAALDVGCGGAELASGDDRPCIPAGGTGRPGIETASASIPARVSAHEVTELQLHISPVRASSRPQVSVGTDGRRSNNASAKPGSVATVSGLSTAKPRSGTTPSRQRRTS